jgi:hypothetical protein
MTAKPQWTIIDLVFEAYILCMTEQHAIQFKSKSDAKQ